MKFLKPGVLKAHADIVGYYMARIQSVVVLVGAFKLLGLSWFYSIGLFIVLLLVAGLVSHFHFKYIFPKEQNYLRAKEPFMVDMDKKVTAICEKLNIEAESFEEMEK